jgi:UDP-N-acetylglucosamine--N-acetylmuramyl-(pentapeptide) pyrophosphoryl-undecaprenol N-acetylglucosamine transferase
MKILLAGGGSGGPVSPVLAVACEIKKLKPRTEFLFVGTRLGPERAMVSEVGIPFDHIPAARWRRFFTYKNLFAPFVFIAGLIKSVTIVRRFRPDVMFSAGGFVAVPVAWVCRFFGVKIIIHQQDAEIGLANKLISPFASQITAAFEQTAKEFYSGIGLPDRKLKPAAEWVGNPVRESLLKKNDSAVKYFKLNENLPILLVLGGATGAKQINDLVSESVASLVKSFQVIHVTGKAKNTVKFTDENYHAVELLSFEVYSSILNKADIVISRAGLSTIAELSALGKSSIIIPMPRTHQESNALILAHTRSALVLLREQTTSANFIKAINMIKFDPALTEELKNNISRLMPRDAAAKIAKIIIS